MSDSEVEDTTESSSPNMAIEEVKCGSKSGPSDNSLDDIESVSELRELCRKLTKEKEKLIDRIKRENELSLNYIKRNKEKRRTYSRLQSALQDKITQLQKKNKELRNNMASEESCRRLNKWNETLVDKNQELYRELKQERAKTKDAKMSGKDSLYKENMKLFKENQKLRSGYFKNNYRMSYKGSKIRLGCENYEDPYLELRRMLSKLRKKNQTGVHHQYETKRVLSIGLEVLGKKIEKFHLESTTETVKILDDFDKFREINEKLFMEQREKNSKSKKVYQDLRRDFEESCRSASQCEIEKSGEASESRKISEVSVNQDMDSDTVDVGDFLSE